MAAVVLPLDFPLRIACLMSRDAVLTPKQPRLVEPRAHTRDRSDRGLAPAVDRRQHPRGQRPRPTSLQDMLSHVEAEDATPTVSDYLADARRQRTKRAIDLLVGTAFLPIALPLMIVVAVLIRIDSEGPVLFWQDRLGYGGRRFRMCKFRTMHADADRDPEIAFAEMPEVLAEWHRTHKLRNDPRLTRVGRWLRRTSLDELPQLFNVLRGEMSLVGPRPIVTDETFRYGRLLPALHCVKPGLTGLWQVSGRNETTYRRRVALDTAYVRHWSLRLDLAILLRTAGSVVRGRGAF